MYRLYLFKAGLLVFGLGLITLGIIIMVQGEVVLEYATIFGGVILLLHGAHLIFNIFMKYSPFNKRRRTAAHIRFIPTFIAGCLNVGFGALALLWPNITLRFLLVLLTCYVFLNAIVKYIDFIIAHRNNSRRKYAHIIAAVFFTVFGIMMGFVNVMDIRSLLVVSGVYLILYGFCQLNDFIGHLIPLKTKRKIRISLPVFISTFLPRRFMNNINRYFSEDVDDDDLPLHKKRVVHKNEDAAPSDVEVLIHIGGRSAGRMGHLDLIIDGVVYSYGNYDFERTMFFRTYGDGVLFTAKKEPYINHVINVDKKTVICYGLRLNKTQADSVRREIGLLMEQTYPWKPPPATGKGRVLRRAQRRRRMWEGSNASCFKFNTGRFKTYFVLSTNCVLLADTILGKAGTDIIKVNGIITPGSYFDYLQNQFFLKKGIVMSRVIHKTVTRPEKPEEVEQERELALAIKERT
jgi:uncharacterized membrane protein HdeD (DUF308 family)